MADRDRELIERAKSPSFTPARRDLPAIVALLAAADDDAGASRLHAAILRADAAPAREAIEAALPGAPDGAAVRLIAALGAIARRDPSARARVLAILAD